MKVYTPKSNRKRPWKKAPKEYKKDLMKRYEKEGKDTEGKICTIAGKNEG